MNLWLAVIATTLSAAIAVATVIYALTYFRATAVKAQLEAKDAAIKTNQQTIESMEQRLDELELLTKASQSRILHLESELAASNARYEHLRTYAAPDLVPRLLEILDGHGLKLDALVEMLVPEKDREILRQALSAMQTRRAARVKAQTDGDRRA